MAPALLRRTGRKTWWTHISKVRTQSFSLDTIRLIAASRCILLEATSPPALDAETSSNTSSPSRKFRKTKPTTVGPKSAVCEARGG